jgi:hypothetical protein
MKFDFRKAGLNVKVSEQKGIFPARFETAKQAREARQRLVTALEQIGKSGRDLSRRIQKCSMRPCRSAACPICLRHFRLWWGSEIAAYVAIDPEDWYTVNIVPSELFFAVGELDRFRWDHVKDRLRKQIARSFPVGAIVLGGFDYALQTFDDGRHPKWRPHIYLLIQAGGKERIRRAFDKHYPKDKDTPTPVMITEQGRTDKDRIATATYSFKSYFYDRQPKRDKRGNADTDKSPLEPSHQAELALLLDQQGFLGRMIRHGSDPSFSLLTTR